MFARKVRNSPELKEPDFKNNFERNRLPSDETNCDEVCGMHGVSFEIWNDKSKDVLLERYKYTATIARKYKNNLCVLKFREGSGMVKYTPEQAEYNEYHYDFYKSDDFSFAHCELVEMIKLTPNV